MPTEIPGPEIEPSKRLDEFTDEERKAQFNDVRHKTQILPFYDADDGMTKERHEYQGPRGSGHIDFFYKTINGKKLVKVDHYGPESRPSHDWMEEKDAVE